MNKKLYRSDENKVLLGICGGIGEYFDVDPVIIRVILVVLIFLGFSGIFAYIVAAFIIPKKPGPVTNVTYAYKETKDEDSKLKEPPASEGDPNIIKTEQGTYRINK